MQNAAVQRASLAIVNGLVWAPGGPPATAVAIRDERIAALGSDDDIRSLIDPDTRVIDARGGTILPAFNDSHLHFLMGSRGLRELDLSGADSLPDVERRIRDYAAAQPGTGWVIGRGWLYAAFPGAMPSLALLDELVPDRPAYLESFDTHTAWVNSRAMQGSGVPSSPPGILKEAAMDDFAAHLPGRTLDQDLDALREGMRLAASRGIGSIQEASRGLGQLPLYEKLFDRGELTMRVRLAFDMSPGYSMQAWERRLDLYEEAARSRPNDGWISTGIVKAFADGVVESRTASLISPYTGMAADDPGALGAPNWDRGELAAAVRAASDRGWQVEVHAIGDRAIRDALDALAACDSGRRHRVEHIEVPAEDDIRRFGEHGVVASMQPQHADPNLTTVWRRNLGAARAVRGWPWRMLLASGARLAFGTDWPVVPIDPFASLQIATEEHSAQRIGIEEAVAAWTSGAAYAEHLEMEKGTLEPGMLADIAVLDRDLASTPAGELAQIKVEATVVGGRLVYER